MVIGTIGDASHSSQSSDHNPDPDGSVDAIDAMIGPHYTTAHGNHDVAALIKSRDKRIKYIIWQQHIISSVVSPWVWRAYNGDDPHTGHWHLSTLDQYEKSTAEWSLYVPSNVPTIEIGGTKPLLRQGMTDDNMPGGVAHIHRLQRELRITDDGVFGPVTDEALRKFLGTSYHGTVDMDAWRKILGLW
jgi:hypothetical protein